MRGPVEYVLPFIVERKRMDDLASSIIDKRFEWMCAKGDSVAVPNGRAKL